MTENNQTINTENTPQRVYKTPEYVRNSIKKYQDANREKIYARQKEQKKEKYANNEEFKEWKRNYNKQYNERLKEQRQKRAAEQKSLEQKIDLILDFVNSAAQSRQNNEPIRTYSLGGLD